MRYTLLFLLQFIVCFICSGQQTGQRPNIVFIMSDDHAYQAVSAYGHEIGRLAPTPNIDRIAEEGLLFTNSFVTNSICAPSRAVMLTGKYSQINGVKGNRDVFDGSQQTFPKLLQKNGYQTAVVGKWHLKSNPTGFDYWSILPGQGDYYNPDFITMGKRKREEGYSTQVVREKAVNWLEQRQKDQPFALLIHFKAPHRNWMPETSKLSLYEDIEFPLPATFFDDYEGREAAKAQEMSIMEDMTLESDLKMLVENKGKKGKKGRLSILERKLRRMDPEQKKAWMDFYEGIQKDFNRRKPKGKELAKWKYQRYMRDYLKTVASVDENVGKVLDYLKQEGLLENTIVVYTADQGFYLGEHGWFDKRFMYEQSLSMPLLIRYPGTPDPGTVYDGMVQNLDFAPTFLDLAGVEIPDDMQGESLVPVLKGDTSQLRDAVYYHYYEYPAVHRVKRHYGVRTARYKLIHFYNDIDTWELYDLIKDPKEMNNVYDDPAYAGTVQQLKVKLEALRRKYDGEGALAP